VLDQLGRLLAALEAEPDPPTTVREAADALRVHIADSLSGLEAEPVAAARSIADLGAGAGFPGLVLAAALPATRVDLVESTRRKCEVIDRLATAAGLGKARSVASRAEEWAIGEGREGYEVVTARALAPLPVVAEYAAPLLAPGGYLVAWKGIRDPEEEAAGAAAAAPLGLSVGEVLAVTPFPEAHSRHLHLFQKTGATPPGFPRRPGMAAKRPLA